MPCCGESGPDLESNLGLLLTHTHASFHEAPLCVDICITTAPALIFMVIKMPCAHFTDEKVQNKLQLTQLVTVPVVSYSEPVYCNHVTSPGGRIGRGPQIDHWHKLFPNLYHRNQNYRGYRVRTAVTPSWVSGRHS